MSQQIETQKPTEFKEYVTTLSLKYCKNWGNWEAIREIVQNTLDELGTMPTITHSDNGDLTIKDNGSGLSLKQLCLLGISEKNTDDARGQYGEGLKIALLIFVRSGYNVEIRSQNFLVKIDKVLQFEEEVLRYQYIDALESASGLQITVKNFKEKFDFMHRFNVGQKEVLASTLSHGQMLKESTATLYVKNIYVKELIEDKAVFSYDLKNIALERDRNTPNNYNILHEIGYIFQNIDNETLINQIFDIMKKTDALESNINHFYPNFPDLWVKVFYAKYGSNATISTDDELSQKARYHGFKNIVFRNNNFVSGLSIFGIKYTSDAISEKIANRREKTVNEFTKKETQNIQYAIETIKECTELTIPTLKVYTSSKNDDVLGYCDNNQNLIGISRKILKSKGKLLTCLIEELVHYNFKVHDATADFQQKFVSQMGLIVSYLTVPKTKNNNIASFSAKLIKQTLNIKKGQYIQYSLKIPMGLNPKLADKAEISVILECA